MRRIALLAGLSAIAACGEPATVTRPYEWNDLRLITSYTAKTACSCLFVEGRTMEQCIAYAKENPPVASWSADTAKKTVTSSALLLWGASAHFVDDKFGCVLDD